MAEPKSEQPTAKKLRDARERGEIPQSREVFTATAVLSVTAALAFWGAQSLTSLSTCGRAAWSVADTSHQTLSRISKVCGVAGLKTIVPILLAVFITVILVGVLQTGALFAPKAVRMQSERFNPVQNLARVFSASRLVDVARSLVSMFLIGAFAISIIKEALRSIVTFAGDTSFGNVASTILKMTSVLSLQMLCRVGGALLSIAALDWVYQRWKYMKDQRMTKEEVRRESREAEGDPHIKRRREQMHKEIMTHAVLEEVRRADVLVVNPTHFAVALRFDEESEQEAPEILAKGQDELARRMMDVAREAGVPVLRDVPLAQALFELEVGNEIPEILYEAVAVILRAAWAEREEVDRGSSQ